MNIGLIGDCDKVDLALMTGLLLKTHRDNEPVTIVSDRIRHYRYFQNEVNGMGVQANSDAVIAAGGIAIYDWHSSELPNEQWDKKYVVTTYEKASLEFAAELIDGHETDGLIVLESECSITPKYIAKLFPNANIYSYYDDSRRRVDWVFDGRISTRRLESDFIHTVSSLARDIGAIPEPEVKKLWNYLKKRSA